MVILCPPGEMWRSRKETTNGVCSLIYPFFFTVSYCFPLRTVWNMASIRRQQKCNNLLSKWIFSWNICPIYFSLSVFCSSQINVWPFSLNSMLNPPGSRLTGAAVGWPFKYVEDLLGLDQILQPLPVSPRLSASRFSSSALPPTLPERPLPESPLSLSALSVSSDLYIFLFPRLSPPRSFPLALPLLYSPIRCLTVFHNYFPSLQTRNT